MPGELGKLVVAGKGLANEVHVQYEYPLGPLLYSAAPPGSLLRAVSQSRESTERGEFEARAAAKQLRKLVGPAGTRSAGEITAAL